jgi:hypothetical protein
MTQDHILVSPLLSARPKSGAQTPAFRPAEPGDTNRRFEALNLNAPSYFRSPFPVAPASWTAVAPYRFSAAMYRPTDTHFTRIVPHFFALYRETEFFLNTQNAESKP